MSVSLAIVKDASLNVRRDFIEEKELVIRQGIRAKIVNALPRELPQSFAFTFSVMTDDGNLQSALIAGANDLLSQSGLAATTMWSCFLLLYSEGSESKWVIDPSFEELNNLSNNLLLVTIFKNDRGDKLVLEKATDQLRTSFAVQQSSTLSFKGSGMTLAQIREGTEIGRAVCNKALAAQRDAMGSDEGYQIVI